MQILIIAECTVVNICQRYRNRHGFHARCCKGILSHIGKGFGNGDLFKGRTECKACIRNGLDAVSKIHITEVLAVGECIIVHLDHTVRQGNALDLGICKRPVVHIQHTVRNFDRFQVLCIGKAAGCDLVHRIRNGVALLRLSGRIADEEFFIIPHQDAVLGGSVVGIALLHGDLFQ